MLTGVLYSMSVVAHLALVGLLLFLCFRTRSKGLMLMSAILLTGGIYDWIFDQVVEHYVVQWIENQEGYGITERMSPGELLMVVACIESLLYNCLCLLGGFLVYREWRHGKFHQPST